MQAIRALTSLPSQSHRPLPPLLRLLWRWRQEQGRCRSRSRCSVFDGGPQRQIRYCWFRKFLGVLFVVVRDTVKFLVTPMIACYLQTCEAPRLPDVSRTVRGDHRSVSPRHIDIRDLIARHRRRASAQSARLAPAREGVCSSSMDGAQCSTAF